VHRKQVFPWFFITIFLLLIYIFYQILSPFILALFWGAVITLALYPAHKRLTKLLRNRKSISALIMAVVATFLVILPLCLFRLPSLWIYLIFTKGLLIISKSRN